MPKTRSVSRLAAIAVLLAAAGARAGEPSASDRDTARTLALAGQNKLKDGDFAGAAESCRAAHAIMGVPSTALCVARAELGLGHLVEAANSAHEAAIYPESTNNVFNKAREQAAELEAQLLPRIPDLRMDLVSRPAGLKVTVDGDAIAGAALDLPRRVNPGTHRVVASAPGFDDFTATATVAEGEHKAVAIALAPSPLKHEPPPPKPQKRVPPWAWISGGAGLAAVAAGIGFAVDYGAATAKFNRDCGASNKNGEPVCDPAQYSLDDANALYDRRVRSGALAIGFELCGAAALAAGVVGIVRAKAPAETGVQIAPGIGSIALQGAF